MRHILTACHLGGDCVQQNLSDLGIRFTSVQVAQSTSQNQIGIILQNIMSKIADMSTKHRRDGQRAGKLENIAIATRNVITKKTQENFDNAKNKTADVVGSQKEFGPCASNLGLGIKNEMAHKESTRAIYIHSLAAVSGNVSKTSPGCKSELSAPKTYNGKDWFGRNVENVRNFRKWSGNSEMIIIVGSINGDYLRDRNRRFR